VPRRRDRPRSKPPPWQVFRQRPTRAPAVPFGPARRTFLHPLRAGCTHAPRVVAPSREPAISIKARHLTPTLGSRRAIPTKSIVSSGGLPRYAAAIASLPVNGPPAGRRTRARRPQKNQRVKAPPVALLATGRAGRTTCGSNTGRQLIIPSTRPGGRCLSTSSRRCDRERPGNPMIARAWTVRPRAWLTISGPPTWTAIRHGTIGSQLMSCRTDSAIPSTPSAPAQAINVIAPAPGETR